MFRLNRLNRPTASLLLPPLLAALVLSLAVPAHPAAAPGQGDAEDFGTRPSGRRVPRGRRGIQAVLLSHWSRTSCDNFLGVCLERDAPGEIEIAFVPYIKDQNIYPDGDVRYRTTTSDGLYAQYETMRYILDRLLLAGKTVTVTTHFGFHAGGYSPNRVAPNSTQLRRMVRDFEEKLFRPYQGYRGQLRFVLSPSLEDEYRDRERFEAYVEVIARQLASLGALTLDESSVVNNAWVRRSHHREMGTYALAITDAPMRRPDGGLARTWKINVRQTEGHGRVEVLDTSFGVYSNDGLAVLFDNPRNVAGLPKEDRESLDNATASETTKYSLSRFIRETSDSRKVVLLWRPSYNLFAKSRRRDGGVRYEKVDMRLRGDSDDAPKFDRVEQEALRLFLGIQ